MAETAGVCIKEQSRLCERWVRPELQRISGASSMEEFCLQTGSLRFHTSKNILQELMLHSVSCLSPKTKLSPPPPNKFPPALRSGQILHADITTHLSSL